MKHVNALSVIAAFVLLFALVGCGDKSSADASSPGITPAVSTVTISAESNATSIAKGSTLQFSVSVTGTGDPSQKVTWSIVETGKHADTNINASGLLTVSAAETLTSLTIRAVPVDDTSKHADKTITVYEPGNPPTVSSVTVSAAGSATSVPKGSTLQFSAVVNGSYNPSQEVTWSISQTGKDAGTSISSGGLLTVSINETLASLTVVATSVADTGKTGTQAVTITAAAFEVYDAATLKKVGTGEDGWTLSASYKQTADINMTGQDWTPIGDSNSHFTGRYDGNQKKITGLTYKVTANGPGIYLYAGLFGYADGAIISDLGLENADIDVSLTTTYGAVYVGGIAGWAGNLTITGCYSTGSIKGQTNTPSSFSLAVGGLVGYARLGNNYPALTMTGCYNTAIISVVSDATDSCAGGLIGCCSEQANITNCYNEGSISASAYHSIVGGIAGYFSGTSTTITGCYNKGTINADSTSSGCQAGGIGGQLSATYITISKSYNIGNVTSTLNPDPTYTHNGSVAAGGIVGDMYRMNTISTCYNMGKILASSNPSNISNDSYAYAGGITANATYPVIKDCYTTGDVTSSATTGVYTYYDCGSISGGIVGYLISAPSTNSTITRSYSSGNIKATGLCATNNNPTVSTAGIVGYLIGTTSANTSSISYCAAMGNTITSSSNSAKYCYAGRILGYLTDDGLSESNNFALNTMTAAGIPFTALTPYDGIDKTGAELTTLSTWQNAVSGEGEGGFGWNFGSSDDNPWQWGSGSYPVFYWQ